MFLCGNHWELIIVRGAPEEPKNAFERSYSNIVTVVDIVIVVDGKNQHIENIKTHPEESIK